MKSIKPGRGPSMMGGVVSILVGVLGVCWTIGAASIGAPIYFCLFGVVFVIIAIAQGLYQFNNATRPNRYSEFDITDENEEPDPLSQRLKSKQAPQSSPASSGGNFCPYCGAPVQSDFAFCRQCGKQLPKE